MFLPCVSYAQAWRTAGPLRASRPFSKQVNNTTTQPHEAATCLGGRGVRLLSQAGPLRAGVPLGAPLPAARACRPPPPGGAPWSQPHRSVPTACAWPPRSPLTSLAASPVTQKTGSFLLQGLFVFPASKCVGAQSSILGRFLDFRLLSRPPRPSHCRN